MITCGFKIPIGNFSKELIKDTLRNPFEGVGKPEPLKANLSGYWSRRINTEHRLVYEVLEDSILVVACRFHYQD
jgi:toxin YoeB